MVALPRGPEGPVEWRIAALLLPFGAVMSLLARAAFRIRGQQP